MELGPMSISCYIGFRSTAGKAIEKLQSAVPYQTGTLRLLVGAMYPVYVRGETFLAEGRGADAAAEFQKILDHRAVVVSDPVCALARLELSRAYLVAGDGSKAKATYQDFFALWNGADPDIPVLKRAKSEFGNLH